jgi:hypothetical protein
MLRGHIACQQGGQAARPFCHKCRDRAAYRSYVRLCPLAYVMGYKPRGSSGSPPGRGAQAHMIRPDTCHNRTLAYARVSPSLGPCCGPDLLEWDLDPIQGTRHAYLGVPDRNRGSGLCVQGSGALLRRSGPTDTSWDVSPFLATWCPLSRPCGGAGCCLPCG